MADSMSNALAFDPALLMADSLSFAGFYFDAITEYERFLFFNPGASLVSVVQSKIGTCRARLGEWDNALAAMDLSVTSAGSDSVEEVRRIDRAVILLAAGSFEEARIDLVPSVRLSNGTDPGERARVLLFLSYVLEHDWDTALDAYRAMASPRPEAPDTIESILLKASTLRYKSPDTAALLSIFMPGLGQIYCGRYLSGLNALVLNAATGYAVTASILKESYVSAILLFTLTFERYYLGNSYQAHRSAIEYNEAIEARCEKEIEELLRQAYPLNSRAINNSSY